MIKKPIVVEFDLDSNFCFSTPLAISHIDDKNTEVLNVIVNQSGNHVDLTGATAIARMVLYAEKNYLINDNVSCQIDANGDILLPFDNAVAKIPHGVIKIEVSVTRENDILTLQFPLFVFVNDTILANAEITPESEGTIPELLEKVKQELERVEGYVDEEQVKDIIDGVLSGVTTNIPTLLIDNTVNQQYNPEGHLIWYYIDSDGARHNLFDFTPYLGGTDDYNDLNNKPTINGVAISGDIQTSRYLRYDRTGDETYYLHIDAEGVFQKTATFSFIHSDYGSSFCGLNPRNRWYPDEYPTDDNGILFRFINSYTDDSYKKTFVEPNYFFFSSVENAIYLRTDHYTYPDDVFVKGEWRKIGSGSSIASGVVNQNGTISFYDADGNLLFTTTGASVIGPQGAPGQNYVLTPQDKADIANIVLQELPTSQGVLYGD